jgi:hypothetical protein
VVDANADVDAVADRVWSIVSQRLAIPSPSANATELLAKTIARGPSTKEPSAGKTKPKLAKQS